jgi:hypothetical protein
MPLTFDLAAATDQQQIDRHGVVMIQDSLLDFGR